MVAESALSSLRNIEQTPIRGFSSGRVEFLCERDMAQVQVNQGVMKQVLKAPPGGARSVQVGDQVHVHCTGYIQATMGKFWR